MIYVTHDQVEAMTLGDKIVVLNGGRIEQVGAPLALYQRPCNQFVAGFFGSSRMNFVSCRALSAGPHGVAVALPGGERLSVPVEPGRVIGGQTLILGVRPEHVLLEGGDAQLAGPVEAVEELGEGHLVYLRATDGTLVAGHFAGAARWREGEAGRLGIRAGSCHLFLEDGTALTRRVGDS
jgi:multiple sugar transport system ATP-binding protein